ncbi:MAG: tetratricopeptide repeat protein [Segniliparus sp.]|uniref:tetratricopeptide repeat protein n=1 Tax=Segniliparus sp. TaxID=2804064 RepID=UPI003F3EA771
MHGAVDLSALKAQADRPAPPQAPSQAAPPVDSEHVFDVSEEDFEIQVLERSTRQVVVVDLWATWCQPCKQLSPVLEGLAAQSGGRWVLAKVDVDENQRIAQIFGARSVPTVVAIAAGRPVSAFQGAQPESAVKQWLADVLEQAAPVLGQEAPAEESVDPRLVAASEALASNDFATAKALFEDIKARGADETEGSQKAATRKATAEAGLREVAFLERVSAISPEVLRVAQENPGDIDAQLAAADLEVAAGRADQAFDRLIGAVKASPEPGRTAARKRLLDLFELFEPADQTVIAARRKLASALY